MRDIRFKTVERMPRGNYNPNDNIVIKVSGKRHELESGHGSHDDVDVLVEDDGTVAYIIVRNSGLGYVGANGYDLDREPEKADYTGEDKDVFVHKPYAEVFMDSDTDVEETFGEDGFSNLSGEEVLEALSPWLQG